MSPTRKRVLAPIIAAAATIGIAIAPAAASAPGPINFEGYSTGTINGQFGWSSLGAAGSGCAIYDHAVDSSLGTTGFGALSLRISNAVTSGCYSDQTFSPSLTEAAGETGADPGTLSAPPTRRRYEASWQFASTTPTAEQPGLSVVASPDRGDGARMSWVQMTDTPTGLAVNFYDYQDVAPYGGLVGDPAGCDVSDDFFLSPVASGLDRSVPHTIDVTMDFVDGSRNDVVKVYVDGVLGHTGTSWEDYFRYCEGNPTRTVDSVLFRTGGTAAPANAGKGFLIDNLNVRSDTVVLTKNDCKKNGWKSSTNPVFKNQGDCVSYFATRK